MYLKIDIQTTIDIHEYFPKTKELQHWIRVTLDSVGYKKKRVTLVIRVVNEVEIANLNAMYRNIAQPTNVLAFPSKIPKVVRSSLIGDIVLCLPIILTESLQQNKNFNAHLAHILIHGLLHLLGYKHEDDKSALVMEKLETRVINKLGYPDPYGEEKQASL